MKYDDQYDIARFPGDSWIDEIQILGPSGLLLRLVEGYRYKTSGLSGNEWRTSYMWQCTPEAPMVGAQPEAIGIWSNFDGPYGSLYAGCAALYPGLYGSQPQSTGVGALSLLFNRKGRTLYGSSYDGETVPLPTLAAHLPWALVTATDKPLGSAEAWDDMRRLCHQPGCSNPACSTYLLRETKQDPRPIVRRFCVIHLRRGNSRLQDNDEGYEVLDGPGPEESQGWRHESPARRLDLEVSLPEGL